MLIFTAGMCLKCFIRLSEQREGKLTFHAWIIRGFLMDQFLPEQRVSFSIALSLRWAVQAAAFIRNHYCLLPYILHT